LLNVNGFAITGDGMGTDYAFLSIIMVAPDKSDGKFFPAFLPGGRERLLFPGNGNFFGKFARFSGNPDKFSGNPDTMPLRQ
jgi:hypothetical protein